MTEEPEPRESILGILRSAINIEKFGNYYYNSLGNIVENPEGKALLTHLANAEQEHMETLEDKLIQFGGQAKETPMDELISDVIKNENIEKVFTELLNKSTLEKIDAIEAVKIGIEVEQKSIDFYIENSQKSEETEIITLFTELSNMEKEHLEILQENLRNLEDEGIWYGYVPILD